MTYKPTGNAIGCPRQYKSPKDMQAVIDAYFDECDEGKRPYTVSGLALALDLTRQGLLNYQGRPEFVDTVKRAKQRVEVRLEEDLVSGKAQAGIIFNFKNNYGYVDRIENAVEVKTIEDIIHDLDGKEAEKQD